MYIKRLLVFERHAFQKLFCLLFVFATSSVLMGKQNSNNSVSLEVGYLDNGGYSNKDIKVVDQEVSYKIPKSLQASSRVSFWKKARLQFSYKSKSRICIYQVKSFWRWLFSGSNQLVLNKCKMNGYPKSILVASEFRLKSNKTFLDFIFKTKISGNILIEGEVNPGKVKVPDVVGLLQEDAKEALSEAGFNLIEYAQVYSNKKLGSVVTQSPIAGEAVLLSDKISLYTSKGPEPITISNYMNRSTTDVKLELEALNFIVTIQEEYSGSIPSGSVVKTEPGPGAQIPPGSDITVISSKGKEAKTLVEQIEELEDQGKLLKLDRTDSLVGVDSDNNGVRDDIDGFINSLNLTPKQAAAFRHEARAYTAIMEISDLENAHEVEHARLLIDKGTGCMNAVFRDGSPKLGIRIYKRIAALQLNTRDRSMKYLRWNEKLSGGAYRIIRPKDCGE